MTPEDNSDDLKDFRFKICGARHDNKREVRSSIAMSVTLELDHRRPITYESAIKKDSNIIEKLRHFEAAKQLYESLWDQRAAIQDLVRELLGLGSLTPCSIAATDRWIRGSFNVCIPLQIQHGLAWKKYMFRCPMPHKFAEARFPSTIDEKLSCEAATYIWMQTHCADVRIPHLYAFGFSDQRRVSLPREFSGRPC